MGGLREWEHIAEFPEDASSVSQARAFVTGHLVDHGLSAMVGDLQLVVSELATNALLHGGTGFLVVLFGFDGSVRIEVHDASLEVPVRIDAAMLAIGGRGVSIVDTLSRDWGVTRPQAGGKTVWAEFDRAEFDRAG
jgi:anti-sigma regulatory factor (Ser/Thr protein kinase)